MKETKADLSQATRLRSLDYFRTLCALAVIIHHWRFFLFPLDEKHVDHRLLPLYGLLEPIYNFGHLGVELFFVISGFVFFWLYAEKIHKRSIKVITFAQARVARLYPLYISSALVVIGLQALFRGRFGQDFVYPSHDGLSFIPYVFMLHMWSHKAPQIFNGPAWSISVEVFLYGLFFLLCLWRRSGKLSLVGLIVFGLVIRKSIAPLGLGLAPFFCGGLSYLIYQDLSQKTSSLMIWRKALGGLCLALWGVTYVKANVYIWSPLVISIKHNLPTLLVGVLTLISHLFSTVSFWLVLGPLSLVVLALGSLEIDRWVPASLKLMGEISYSIYMWHFPMILALTLGFSQWIPLQRIELVRSPLFMLIFLMGLMGLAVLSYLYVEDPLRQRLRQLGSDASDLGDKKGKPN